VVSDAVRTSYRRINAGHWARLEAGETTPERLRIDRWAELLAVEGHDVEPRAVADAYITHLAAGAHLVDGALEVLDDLARDHRIAFITNGLADVQRPRLSAAGLLHRAETVVISDEVGVAKPEPAIFDLVLAGMGRPDRSRVLMIGDSLTSDIAGGHDAGLDTAWVNPEGEPHDGVVPTYTIGSVRDLAGVVRG
jgi:2-haloacid dehalogenase